MSLLFIMAVSERSLKRVALAGLRVTLAGLRVALPG
jgi:hypothetical protein